MKTFSLTSGILVCFLILASLPLRSQDANFSQFYNNPIYYNPGLTGISSGLHIRSQYRKLWPRVNSNFRTCNLTVDMEEINVSGGLGFIATSSAEGGGLVKATRFGGLYSYRLIVIPREFILQFGFQAAYVEKHIEYDGFVFSDQLDPVLGDIYESSFQHRPEEKVIYPDFSSGVVARFNIGKRRKGKPAMTNTIGVACHHITQPNESFLGFESKLPIKTVVHLNSIIPMRYHIDKFITFAPAFIYENQGIYETFTGGINVVKEPVYMGLWMRNQNFKLQNAHYDALVVMVGIKQDLDNMKFRLGYSYDMTISKLRSSTAGTHEISLTFTFEDFQLFNSNVPSLKARARSNKVCFSRF